MTSKLISFPGPGGDPIGISLFTLKHHQQKKQKKIRINLNCRNGCGDFSVAPQGTSRRGISQMFRYCRLMLCEMEAEKNHPQLSRSKNNLIFMTLLCSTVPFFRLHHRLHSLQ